MRLWAIGYGLLTFNFPPMFYALCSMFFLTSDFCLLTFDFGFCLRYNSNI